MRRQWQIIGHELAASFDRNNVRKFFFGQCFELLFGGKAFIGDHRVLLAGDAAFVEYVGKRTDVRGADEKLLLIHRSAGIGGKAVDIEQIDLWLEAPLRVVSQLCQFHGFGGSDQSMPVEKDEDIVAVHILLHEATDCFTASSQNLEKGGIAGGIEREVGQKVRQKTRLIVHLQTTEARLLDGAQNCRRINRLPNIRKEFFEALAHRNRTIPKEQNSPGFSHI